MPKKSTKKRSTRPRSKAKNKIKKAIRQQICKTLCKKRKRPRIAAYGQDCDDRAFWVTGGRTDAPAYSHFNGQGLSDTDAEEDY